MPSWLILVTQAQGAIDLLSEFMVTKAKAGPGIEKYDCLL